MMRRFHQFARRVTAWSGSPLAALGAFLLVVSWTLGGFVFGFTDTYQLIINTGTTIVTFLMVFLIQAEQNLNDEALHLKVDELLRAVQHARDDLIDVENQSAEHIREQKQHLKED